MSGARRRGLLPVDFRIEEHRGEWVVLVNDRIVETGADLCTCLARARVKHPREEPFVMKLMTPPRAGRGSPARLR